MSDAVSQKKVAKKKKVVKGEIQDLSQSYNAFKNFQGQFYTGMKVGRSHKWYYDKGEWKETKRTPDLWEVSYSVKKRRAGKAPEGSGVPVGTEYHWLILAHQNVKKLDANVYETSLVGLKYKIAHKRAENNKWSLSDNAQKKKLIEFLETALSHLKKEIPKKITQKTKPRLSSKL